MPDTLRAVPSVVKNALLPSECEVQPVTPRLAAMFRDMPPLSGERGLNEGRIAFLLKAVQETVLPFFWTVIKVAGKAYRANGQHTSYMFNNDAGLIQPGMIAVVTTYECDTMEEASTIYGAIDSSKSARTIHDITSAYQGGNSRLQKHHKTFVQLCQTGLVYAVFGVQYDRRKDITPLQRGTLLYENLDFIDTAQKVIQGKTPDTSHMWRAPVLAAMKLTYDIDKAAFREFWCFVQHGNNAPQTPITLRDYLRSTNLSASAVNLKTDPAPVMLEKCIRAWNAWRRDEDLKRCQTAGNIPKPI